MERIQMPFTSCVLLSRFSFESYKIKKNIGLFLTGRQHQPDEPVFIIFPGQDLPRSIDIHQTKPAVSGL